MLFILLYRALYPAFFSFVSGFFQLGIRLFFSLYPAFQIFIYLFYQTVIRLYISLYHPDIKVATGLPTRT